MAVKVVPAVLVCRQPHAALTRAGFDDAGDQQIATQQEVVAFGKRLRIVFVIEEGRAQHRFIVGVSLPQQGIEVRQQTIAQLNG